MSLFDFFFPEQAQAMHLRRIAHSQSGLGRRRISPTGGQTKQRLKSLEEDVGYMALLLGSILQQLDEKGVVRRDDVKAAMAELDSIDGARDGRLDINLLRGLGQ